MSSILSLIGSLNAFLWGAPLLVLLLGTHIYFTAALHMPQRHILKAIRISVTAPARQEGENLSVFASLATILAATLGTGNIVGVSTAIALGGPGAVFWCWITGLLGMATAYAECYLSVLFRVKDDEGLYRGGPMYLWEKGLNRPFPAKLYACFIVAAALFTGCTTQANSIVQTSAASFSVGPGTAGLLAALLTGFVIIGGIRSIGRLCVKVVPLLALLFTAGCLILLFYNRSVLPECFRLILHDAFCGRAVMGGTVASSLMLTLRYGIARGLFTNEAGLGTASIAAASSAADSPKTQALVSMTAVFWDTVVMCLLSSLVIVSNMLLHPSSLVGVGDASLTEAAFDYLPFFGREFLSLCLIAFALTTLIGWSYLGESAINYLTGSKGIFLYKIVYIVMIYIGAVLPLNFVWECTDLINVFLVLLTVSALFLLRKKLSRP